MLQSLSRAFLDTPHICAKPGCQPVSQPGLAWLLPAPAGRCRQLRPVGHRPGEGQRAGVTPAASRHHVAQSAALVDQTIDLGDTMQLSEETERRRRSLEQSYDAAATPDLFDEARRQQVRCVHSLLRCCCVVDAMLYRLSSVCLSCCSALSWAPQSGRADA
jgi:hypothetical protein